MAAEVHTIIALLSDGPLAKPTGAIFPVGFTATITSVVGRWVAGTITLDQTLPRGRYAVVGAACFETDCLAMRFVPVGEAHRPGCLGTASVGIPSQKCFRNGELGVWFEFDSLTPPMIEILHAAAGAQTVTGVIDLIKVS